MLCKQSQIKRLVKTVKSFICHTSACSRKWGGSDKTLNTWERLENNISESFLDWCLEKQQSTDVYKQLNLAQHIKTVKG